VSGLFMDLLGPILAYLGTVTLIIVTVATSYVVFVYTPLHSINPQHTVAAAANPSAPKAVPASAAKIASPGASAALLHHAAPAAKAAAQTEVAAERRAEARQKHLRKLARQARNKEWVSRQGPRVLGYAQEAPAGLYNAFPYQ
jgi:hypothetical protein